jgi:mannose-6-phosphate isomerase-like protein (cupin superfamily)
MPVHVSLAEKLARVTAPWVPTIVGELNGQYVKVARFEGAYVWHHHDHEDELFLVVRGRVRICCRPEDGGDVVLGPGEFCIVPRGVEHRPVAEEPAEVVLFEPASTRNTGNVDHAYTIEAADLPRL